MREFTLKFMMDNEIFLENEEKEVARILRKVARQHQQGNERRMLWI